jgi:hypothetical protein
LAPPCHGAPPQPSFVAAYFSRKTIPVCQWAVRKRRGSQCIPNGLGKDGRLKRLYNQRVCAVLTRRHGCVSITGNE